MPTHQNKVTEPSRRQSATCPQEFEYILLLLFFLLRKDLKALHRVHEDKWHEELREVFENDHQRVDMKHQSVQLFHVAYSSASRSNQYMHA